jgi:hypothetical protein
MLTSDREDSKLYLTIFILWGVELLYMTLLVMLFQPNLLNSKSYWTIALKHVRAA